MSKQRHTSATAARALELMREALGLLDLGAPAHIGAHLDLAIARLEEELTMATIEDAVGGLDGDALSQDLERTPWCPVFN